ncbi:MAG: hypothetical protein ACETVR_02890 [Candidatus Bathyarchaeia archaeon]
MEKNKSYTKGSDQGDSHIVDLLFKTLEELKLEPRLISPRRVDGLRGGITCFELGAGKSVDAAVLRVRTLIREPLFKVDYAVRGNIRGILPDRIVSKMALRLEGLFRKRVLELRWVIPPPSHIGSSYGGFGVGIEGLPPGPGEVWEGSPHEKLNERINQDADLNESLRGFMERKRGSFLLLSITSDRWGESIRISGDLWLKPEELVSTYATPTYLWIVDRISRHIKEVRKVFGGIAF